MTKNVNYGRIINVMREQMKKEVVARLDVEFNRNHVDYLKIKFCDSSDMMLLVKGEDFIALTVSRKADMDRITSVQTFKSELTINEVYWNIIKGWKFLGRSVEKADVIFN